MRFHPRWRTYLEEQDTECTPLPDGDLEVRMPYLDERWVAQEVIRYLGDAVLVSPAPTRQMIKNSAGLLAARYSVSRTGGAISGDRRGKRMRFLLRWFSNALAFYLAMYLVDSLLAPRFFIGAVWVAILLALFLGVLNSTIRPLHRMRARPGQAWGTAVATVIINALVLQLFMWMDAPLSATGFHWVLVTALFLTILAGLINWLIGFKPPKEPNVITRDLRVSREARGRDTAKAPRPRK